jgi:hypothetical protein
VGSQLGDSPGGPAAYTLVAQYSGKAADIYEASTAVGARLVQWTTNGRSNQQFEFADNPSRPHGTGLSVIRPHRDVRADAAPHSSSSAQ